MADLIDRLSGASELEEPPRPKIPVHQFMGGLRLKASGHVTDAEVKQDFDLQGSELTQANVVLTQLNGLTASAKVPYVLRIEAVAMKLEDDTDTIYHNPDGTIDKVRVQADLDI